MLTVKSVSFNGDTNLLTYRFNDDSKAFSRLSGNEHYPQVVLEAGMTPEQFEAIRHYWMEQESTGFSRQEVLERLYKFLSTSSGVAKTFLEEDIDYVEQGGSLESYAWLFE